LRKSKQKKLKRYHSEIYFPNWTNKSFVTFVDGIHAHGSITFSLHAVERAWEYGVDYGRNLIKFLSRTIREDVLKNGSIFEFYATDEEIHKACFRISSEDSPVDLVLVISSDGVVVTVFVIKKDDNHSTLDENLYERK